MNPFRQFREPAESFRNEKKGMKSGIRSAVTWGCFCILMAAQSSRAQQSHPLHDFDTRNLSAEITPAQLSALESLRTRLPEARVDFDRITGAPKFIAARDGFLSGPGATGRAISGLANLNPTDPHVATKAFLREHKNLFGHGPEPLDTARVTRDYVTPHNGMRTVVWQRQVDGIGVFEAVLISHTTRRGELVNIASLFLPDVLHAADRGTPNRATLVANPKIPAHRAVLLAAANIDEQIEPADLAISKPPESSAERKQKFRARQFKGDAEAQLTWLPMNREKLRLCWDVILMSRARGQMFRVLVDAETGDVLVRRCLTRDLTDASYRVFTGDSPSPFSPGWPTPNTNQPPFVARELVTISAMDTNASPLGWIPDDSNETLGNNVDAHTDRNADNSPDLPRPHGSPSRVFDFPLDLASDPTNYSSAAVVQLFYLCNWYHDKLYELGFTEAAGNFQSNNFGRGGLDDDAVQADAQDGSGYNNANFSTPPDGSPGRMQMYIFTGPNPRRDGDLDAEVVFHEHTHGVSWRLVGGGQALGDRQSDGMGEGWSDFYSLTLLSQPGDDANGVYAAGGYVTYQLSGLTQNYYFGIRRYPYTTDMTKNPLTFKDIDPSQASTHPGVPRSPAVGNSATEVHNEGEVWCVTLWQARANLISKYGWTIANDLVLQLVTDGMKLTPPHPNFLQARDAILQADLVDTGGANQKELWSAFAKRGMGFSATSPDSSTTTGLTEAFDVPDDLQVSPLASFNSYGQIGGPFSPACQFFVVTNAGANTLAWTVTANQPWISLAPSSGTVAPQNSDSVNVCLTPAANALPVGSYAATIVFSNLSDGASSTRTVTLDVEPPQIFSVSFDSDPGWPRQGEWAFGAPLGFGGTTHGKPDPTNGYTGSNVFGINLNGDYSTSIGGPYYLTAGPFDCSVCTGTRLQFHRWLNSDYQPYVYATIDISTNGSTWSMFWSNGISEISDATWTHVSYDISSYADKQPGVYIRWGHRVASAGAYAYSGWNIDDVELLGTPAAPLNLLLPASAPENVGVLTNRGIILLAAQLPADLVISLASSAPERLIVPANVTIPAGQLKATFDITLSDNSVHDGDALVTISASADGFTNITDSILVIDDDLPPVITTQPSSMTVPVGGAATFSVVATGKSPLSYTWFRNNIQISSGTNLPTYSTNNIQLTDSGTVFNCIISNAVATLVSSNATLIVTTNQSIFHADFESGLEGFTINNDFGSSNGLWHLTTARAANFGHSQNTSLYYGHNEGATGGGNYDIGLANGGVVVSPPINLPIGGSNLVLSFNYLISVESLTGYDQAFVEISTNNGSSYNLIESKNVLGGLTNNTGGMWVSNTASLSAFSGSPVILRFRFDTIDSVLNDTEGWYLDDVDISRPAPSATRAMSFASVVRDASGVVHFSVLGSPGDIFRVLVSSNLMDWDSFATATNLTGSINFDDNAATDYGARFYRLVTP
jgi:hypothetical protein